MTSIQIVILALAAVLMTALAFRPDVVLSVTSRVWHLATFEGGWFVQRVNRSDPEKVFIAVKSNYATASLVNGQAVQWDFAVAADGLSVTRPSARATGAGFTAAGIVAETIVSSGYGLIQVYGQHAAVRMREATGAAGNVESTPGRPLALPAAGGVFALEGFATSSISVLVWPCAFMLAATSSWTSSNKAAFIKAL
jgi:hypothetical protein